MNNGDGKKQTSVTYAISAESSSLLYLCTKVNSINTRWSSCQLSVVKPKPKLLLWPTTTVADDPIQSNLKVNACSRHQAPVLVLFLIGWLSGARF